MITQITYARLYNLGSYENERLEVTVQVEENDATAAFITAVATVETEHRRMMDDRRAPAQPTQGPTPATGKQRSYIATLQTDLGWGGEQLAVYAQEQRVDLVNLTLDQASRLINGMKRLVTEHSDTEDIPF